MLNTTSQTKPGLRDYWQIFLRRKWLIILPLAIIPAIAVPGSFLLPPTYEATTTLISQEMSRGFVQSAANINVPRGEELSTIRYKIQSRTYMKEVADNVGIAQYLRSIGKPAEIDDEVRYLREIVQLKALSNMIVEISVQHRKPDMAKNIADTVARTYVDKTLKWRQDSATDTTSFINQELETYRTKLIESEGALVKAQERGVLDSLSVENNSLVNEVAKLRANLVETELDLQEANSEMQNARRLSSSGGDAGSLAALYLVDPEINRLQTDLANLQTQYAQLATKYTDDYPPIKKLKEQIAQTREDLNQAKTKLSVRQQDADTRLRYWTERVRSLELKRSALNAKIAEYDRKLQQLPQRQLELARLQRDRAAAEGTYSMLLQRLNESDLLRSSELQNVGKIAEILDPAIEPNKPIKPNKKKIAVLALAMGLMLGGGATFLLEYFDRSFHSVEEVASYLGIPVVATIPKLMTQHEEDKKNWRKPLIIAGIAIASLLVLVIIADVLMTQISTRDSFLLGFARRILYFLRARLGSA